MYKHLKTLAFLKTSFQIFIAKKIATIQSDIKHQPKPHRVDLKNQLEKLFPYSSEYKLTLEQFVIPLHSREVEKVITNRQ